MKALILLIVLGIAAAESGEMTRSESKLRSCLSLVYSRGAEFKGASKDVVKLVSTGTKACKDEVKGMVRVEREEKRKAKVQAQILKLQAKLK